MPKHRILLLLVMFFGLLLNAQAGPQTGTVTPANSIIGGYAYDQIAGFNSMVRELPNGNIVITSPYWNSSRGAVTCLTPAQYKAGNIVISEANSLVGSNSGDLVGINITILTNGNYVVSSQWTNGTIDSVGAATWVSSTCIPANESSPGAVVSTNNSLVGSHAWDTVGDGVTALSNGHYVVRSSFWDNGTVADVGAITWGNGFNGTVGTVDATNSLIGSTSSDTLSRSSEITALSNGNYVVTSWYWNNSAAGAGYAGAVTWRDGSKSTSGVVDATNSLIGSSYFDRIGIGEVRTLSNGNYIVLSPGWDNLATGTIDAGAATWVNGTTGLPVGAVSSINSVVGFAEGDLSDASVTSLTTGGFVLRSPGWDNGSALNAGAITWGNGTTGITGSITTANSLVGSTSEDKIGSGLLVQNSSSYLIGSSKWDHGGIVDAGAVTWCNITVGCKGPVSASNSLIGSTANDQIGSGMNVLKNGHYVVNSLYWDHGNLADVGAVTWLSGITATTGTVNTSNSLVGTSAGNSVGATVTPLNNGHYVVRSPNWDHGNLADVGAVTWCNGNTSCVGTVSASNSLIGSSVTDRVGSAGLITLPNSSYVVLSPLWDGTNAADLGAATWRDGSMATSGVVSGSNSLIGSTASDQIGSRGYALLNGNYVVTSQAWDNENITDVGAITWGNGLTGTVGVVNVSNSLVGANTGDQPSVTLLNGGNYVVRSAMWDDGSTTNVGSVTWGNGLGGTSGVISKDNSLVGATSDDQIGRTIIQLTNGDYVVISNLWDHAGNTDVGAVTYSRGTLDTGVTLTESNGTEVTESGAGDSYSIVLDSKPTADVIITLGLSSSDISASPTTLTFTSSNWDIPQVVTVNATGDKIAEGVETATITHTVSSTDVNYHLFAVLSVTVTILPDDDTAGVDISKSSISVMEGGAIDAYAVLLTSKPLANVNIAINAPADVSLSATSLVFTPDNWQNPQTIIVAAVDDNEVEGAEVLSITHTVTSTDPLYNNLVIPALSVTIVDNDTASVELLQNGGFETPDASKPSVPDQWSGKQLSKDKLKCNTAEKTFAFEGSCAFLFKGGDGENASLQQKPAFEGMVSAGDTLSLSLYIKTKVANAGKVASVKVTYAEPTTGGDGKDKIEIKLNAPSANGEYQQYLDTLTLADDVANLKVMIRNKNTSGKLLVDSVSLMVSAGANNVQFAPRNAPSFEGGADIETILALPSK
jgi:hypothetical protein